MNIRVIDCLKSFPNAVENINRYLIIFFEEVNKMAGYGIGFAACTMG